MVVLDSNTIIYLSKEILHVEDIFINDEEYGISVVTYMEVLGYDFTSKYEEDFIKQLFSMFKIVYIDEKITKEVISLRKKHKIKLPDAIICATCITSGATLITNDIRLKTIKNLKLKLTAI